MDWEAEFDDAGVHPEIDVGCVDGYAQETGDQDAEEDEADLAQVHVVVDWVDEGEDFEEGVVNAVDDCGVDLDEEDGRVFDCDLEGLDEGVEGDGGEVHVLLVEFGLGFEMAGVVDFAESLGSSEEDGCAACFGKDEEH